MGRDVSTTELKGCLFTLIIFGLISIGPLIASAVLCAKLAPSSCCEPYPNNPGAVLYIPQDNSGHGYVPMQSSSVGQPQPGFTIQPQPGVAMQPQAMMIQPQGTMAMQQPYVY